MPIDAVAVGFGGVRDHCIGNDVKVIAGDAVTASGTELLVPDLVVLHSILLVNVADVRAPHPGQRAA